MQKTINTLSEIIKKYRAKNLRQPDLSQKLAEDLINTIGIHKLDSVTIVKDFLMSKYINVSVGVCIYMCTYKYTYTYVIIHIYIYTYIYIHTYTYIYIYINK